MAASEVILMASGTATLEGMLLKRPMVVAYRLAELTYWIAKPLVKIPFFALPNLLARDKIVPEFIQHQATPQNLGRAIINWLDDTESVKQLEQRFTYLHKQLRQSASQQAAQAIADLIT